jgi:hypothetical protein
MFLFVNFAIFLLILLNFELVKIIALSLRTYDFSIIRTNIVEVTIAIISWNIFSLKISIRQGPFHSRL